MKICELLSYKNKIVQKEESSSLGADDVFIFSSDIISTTRKELSK